MIILLTGGTGFIGSRAADRLKRSGHCVLVSGRGNEGQYRGAHQYVQLDLLDIRQCKRVLEDVDAVVHCAGKAGAWGSHSSYFSANVLSTKNLLKACVNSSVKRFVNISSPSIYFDFKDQFNLKEGALPQRFSNSYAETKFQAENLVTHANSNSLSTISVSPRGVIGAGDRNWLPRIIKMHKQHKLIQPGNGKNCVDFTSIENLLDAIELCMTTSTDNCGRTYNITNDDSVKLWDFIEEALSMAGLDRSWKKVPKGIAMTMARVSERVHRILRTPTEPSLLPIKVAVASYSMTLDISDAKERLGYKPRVSTKEALKEFFEWYDIQAGLGF